MTSNVSHEANTVHHGSTDFTAAMGSTIQIYLQRLTIYRAQQPSIPNNEPDIASALLQTSGIQTHATLFTEGQAYQD